MPRLRGNLLREVRDCTVERRRCTRGVTDRQRILNELLVLRCRRGDADAFQELVKRWEKRLFYYLRRLLDNEEDAWDALQETWLKVNREMRNLRDPAALATWLYRIARNTAVSQLRKTHRNVSLDDDACGTPDGAEDPGIESFPDVHVLHECLRRLPPAQREALTLHFLEDMKVDEIAEVTGAPSGTIKARLFHAKRAMRGFLGKEGVQDG